MISSREKTNNRHAVERHADGETFIYIYIQGANNRPNAMKRPVRGDPFRRPPCVSGKRKVATRPGISCPGSRTDGSTAFAFVAPGIRTAPVSHLFNRWFFLARARRWTCSPRAGSSVQRDVGKSISSQGRERSIRGIASQYPTLPNSVGFKESTGRRRYCTLSRFFQIFIPKLRGWIRHSVSVRAFYENRYLSSRVIVKLLLI